MGYTVRGTVGTFFIPRPTLQSVLLACFALSSTYAQAPSVGGAAALSAHTFAHFSVLSFHSVVSFLLPDSLRDSESLKKKKKKKIERLHYVRDTLHRVKKVSRIVETKTTKHIRERNFSLSSSLSRPKSFERRDQMNPFRSIAAGHTLQSVQPKEEKREENPPRLNGSSSSFLSFFPSFSSCRERKKNFSSLPPPRQLPSKTSGKEGREGRRRFLGKERNPRILRRGNTVGGGGAIFAHRGEGIHVRKTLGLVPRPSPPPPGRAKKGGRKVGKVTQKVEKGKSGIHMDFRGAY